MPLTKPRITVIIMFNTIRLSESTSESTLETSSLCPDLFRQIGAEVSLQHIDIADRISRKHEKEGPKPVICKLSGGWQKGTLWKFVSEWLKLTPQVLLVCWYWAQRCKNLWSSYSQKAILWSQEIQRSWSLLLLLGQELGYLPQERWGFPHDQNNRHGLAAKISWENLNS